VDLLGTKLGLDDKLGELGDLLEAEIGDPVETDTLGNRLGTKLGRTDTLGVSEGNPLSSEEVEGGKLEYLLGTKLGKEVSATGGSDGTVGNGGLSSSHPSSISSSISVSSLLIAFPDFPPPDFPFPDFPFPDFDFFPVSSGTNGRFTGRQGFSGTTGSTGSTIRSSLDPLPFPLPFPFPFPFPLWTFNALKLSN